jgi:hypothetical protein
MEAGVLRRLGLVAAVGTVVITAGRPACHSGTITIGTLVALAAYGGVYGPLTSLTNGSTG